MWRGIVIVGSTSSFGESVFLGYLKKFSPDLVAGWSSGTGFAGLLGAGFYLGLDLLGLSQLTIFALQIPIAISYYIIFQLLLVEPGTETLTTDAMPLLKEDGSMIEIAAADRPAAPGQMWRTFKIALPYGIPAGSRVCL